MISEADFENWLLKYGDAWEALDSRRAIELFTKDAHYYWTPFDIKRGRDEIFEAWEAEIVDYKDVEFASEILAIVGNRGIARWWCSYIDLKARRQAKLEGIFQVDFSENGLCREFREWWHSDEEADG